MDITCAQRAALEEIAGRFDLRLIVLFGSHAGGVTHTASDLDIAVLTRAGRGLSTTSWLDLLADLRLFDVYRGEPLPYRLSRPWWG